MRSIRANNQFSYHVQPGDPITAEDRNALLDDIRRITPVETPLPKASTSFSHPWQCGVDQGSKAGQWNVTMRPGWVNDTEARVAYLTDGDPRGWNMPANYPAALIQNGIAERSWRETDQPPFLLLADDDFSPVADSARPPCYQTAEAWTKSLTMASVFVCALPIQIVGNRIVKPMYRTWAGKIPSQDPFPYGLREVARVYLLTGQSAGDVAADVLQLEFWNLACVPVDPVTLLPNYQPTGDGMMDSILGSSALIGQSLTDSINEALANIGQSTSSVEFWNT